MEIKNLSLLDKINNENVNKSILQIERKERPLQNEFNNIRGKGQRRIKYIYILGVLISIFSYFYGSNSLELYKNNSVNEISFLFALLLWAFYLIPFISFPVFVILSVSELVRIPKRNKYLKLKTELNDIAYKKTILKKKLK